MREILKSLFVKIVGNPKMLHNLTSSSNPKNRPSAHHDRDYLEIKRFHFVHTLFLLFPYPIGNLPILCEVLILIRNEVKQWISGRNPLPDSERGIISFLCVLGGPFYYYYHPEHCSETHHKKKHNNNTQKNNDHPYYYSNR